MDGPWWWSACSPSTPTIWVWIPLTPTIFSVIFEFEKTENKQKKRPGLAHIRRTKFDFYTKSLKLQFEALISAPLSLWKRVSGREREREREREGLLVVRMLQRERGGRDLSSCAEQSEEEDSPSGYHQKLFVLLFQKYDNTEINSYERGTSQKDLGNAPNFKFTIFNTNIAARWWL